MEEAVADNNLELVEESFASLLLSSDQTIPLKYRVIPGALDVIRRSSCLAARLGHADISSFLLDQRAVSATTFSGNKEFRQALEDNGWQLRCGSVDRPSILANEMTLIFLLEHGWNPNLYRENESHPLTYAAAFSPPSTIKILLEHGVSPRDTMAMHAAVCMAADDPTRFEVLDLLLQYGADINEMEVDPKGRKARRQRTRTTGTPLHHALNFIGGDPLPNNIKVVTYLLERGASPTALGWSGHTALQVAEGRRCGGNQEIAKLMRRYCVDHSYSSSLISYDSHDPLLEKSSLAEK